MTMHPDADRSPATGAAAWQAAMEAHERSLTVGTRVRVRLGECPHMVKWHGTIEDGVTGTIFGTSVVIGSSPGTPEGHRYLVWFDQPLRARKAWHYHAAELIPVTHEEILAAIMREALPPGADGAAAGGEGSGE